MREMGISRWVNCVEKVVCIFGSGKSVERSRQAIVSRFRRADKSAAGSKIAFLNLV
jgi:hypothetical protein